MKINKDETDGNYTLFDGVVNEVEISVNNNTCNVYEALKNPRLTYDGSERKYVEKDCKNFKFVFYETPSIYAIMIWDEVNESVYFNVLGGSGSLTSYYVGKEENPNANNFTNITKTTEKSDFKINFPYKLDGTTNKEGDTVYGIVKYNGSYNITKSVTLTVGQPTEENFAVSDYTHSSGVTGSVVKIKYNPPSGKSDDDLKYYYHTNAYTKWSQLTSKDSQGNYVIYTWGAATNGEYTFKVVLDENDLDDTTKGWTKTVTLSNGTNAPSSGGNSGGSSSGGESSGGESSGGESSGGDTGGTSGSGTTLDENTLRTELDKVDIKRYGSDGKAKALNDDKLIKPGTEHLTVVAANYGVECRVNNGNWEAWPGDYYITEDITSLEIRICGYDTPTKALDICAKVDGDDPVVNYTPTLSANEDSVTLTIIVTDVGVGIAEAGNWLKNEEGKELISGSIENVTADGKKYNIVVNKMNSNTSTITMNVEKNEKFTMCVIDSAGNKTTKNINIDSIDEIAPTIQRVNCTRYDESVEWIYNPNGVTIKVTAYDWDGKTKRTEGLSCSFDNGENWINNNEGVFEYIFPKKTENVQIIVKDKAGNETLYDEVLYIPNIDKSVPELFVNVSSETEWVEVNGVKWTSEAILEITAKDEQSGLSRSYLELIKKDNTVAGGWTNLSNPCSESRSFTGQDDEKIYEVSFEYEVTSEEAEGMQIAVHNDVVGTTGSNSQEYEFNFKIDSTGPTINTITGNPYNPVNSSVTLTIDAEDNRSGLAENPYSFDGGETWVATPSKTFSENQEVSIVVKDKAGNTTYETVEIDNIRKFDELEITSNPNIMTYVDGQNFDPTGMVITAKYTAGEDVVLTEDEYTIIYKVEGKTEGHENGKDLVAGVNTITIEYEDEGFDNVKTKRTIDLEITVEELALSNISVQTMPTKTEYYEGQDFDPTGMKIVAFYNNQFATINAQDYEIVDGENLKYNQTTVTIKYTDTTVDGTEITSTTTVPITVIEKELTKIEIKTPPDRTVYVEGESFDKRGMVVEATFNDGSTKTLTDSEYTISSSNAYNMSQGTKDITISYTYRGSSKTQTKDTTQQVTVQKKVLTSIAIKKYATKTSYISSEDFNPAGMEIIAWYNDMLAEKIANDDMGFENISYDEVIKTNQTYVRISYTYDGVTKTVDHPITVRERKLVSIRVDTPPDKTYYIEGQNFVKDGMVIKAKYDSNKEEEITNYTITNGTVLAVGQRSVTISYTEDGITRTTTQPISVEELELTSLQIVQGPDKTTYVEGQDFDTTGMLVRVWYNNCIVQTISDYVLEGNTNLTLGTNKVTVKYTEDGIEVSATVTINVVKKELSGIKITREPDKIKYIEGQNFDTTGMIVEAVYNDDTTKVITEYTVRDGNNLAAGKELVTILYTENGKTVSTTQRISVDEKVITKLEIKQQPTKTKYIEGQNFVKDGMVVIVTYNDGETKEINNYTVVNGKNLTPGNIDIEIKYTEDNITLREYQRIEVEAKILTSIEVATPPNKTQYVEGQNFVADGMVIKANFNDGSTQNVTDYEILDGDYLSAGRKIVTIRYVKDSEVATTTQDIEVAKKVITSLVITTPPDKVNYLEGEDFEKNGMVITAQYNDGETKEITSYTITNGKKLTLEQTSVTISYTEDKITNTVEQNITVKEKLVVNIDTYEEIKDNEKSYLENIMPNTTIAELLEKINTNGNVTIYKNGEIVTNQEENIGTGMEIVITLNDETIRYTVVVTGDLNGDGQMGDADVLIMARYMVSLEENINEASLRAADVMRDGHYATDTDLLKMVRILVGLSTL